MLAQARAELPNECCGMFGGTLIDGVGRVESIYPLVNALASPVDFLTEGLGMFWAEKAMRMRKQQPLAFYHSHPTAPPMPSRKDLAQHYSENVIDLIISMLPSEPDVRGWWLKPDSYEPAEWSCVEDAAMKNPFLISERLYLRALERDDAATLAAWINDPEVNNTLAFQYPLSVAAEQDWIETITKDRDQISLGIVVREEDRFIGALSLREKNERDRHMTFGIAIGDKTQWSKGYGTEATALLMSHAFQTMNLNRVILHVLSENTRAIRAYETVGFKREGLLRQHQFRDGRYQDVVAMALLRDEWKPRKI